MLLHDIIKIKYVDEGYLPYYPYHLISDEEMFEAFREYFDETYPCPVPQLQEQYDELYARMLDIIDMYLSGKIEKIPNWIYSYMLGKVINSHSDDRDKHYVLTMLNLDNLYDDLREDAYLSMYSVSESYIGPPAEDEVYEITDDMTEDQVNNVMQMREQKKEEKRMDMTLRPPTMFGEPHVVRALRLEQNHVISSKGECMICGNKFKSPDPNMKICHEPHEKICVQCEKTFYVKNENWRSRFCSQKCNDDFRREHLYTS